MAGTTFRSQCKLCNEIFFAVIKDTPYCPKCAKRIGYKPPKSARPAPPPERKIPDSLPVQPATPLAVPRPAPAPHVPSTAHIPPAPSPAPTASRYPSPQPVTALNREMERPTRDPGIPVRAPGSARPPGKRPEAGQGRGAGRKPGGKPDGRSAEKAARERTPAAPPGPITDSMRRSVEHAYEYHIVEPDITLAEIMKRIAEEFGLDHRTIHSVINPLHAEHLRKLSLEVTPQQSEQIIARYERMVLNGERPASGRRRLIAREVGVTMAAVLSVCGQWSWHHQDPRQLSRKEKFQIERRFWEITHDPSVYGSGEASQDAPAGSPPTFEEAARHVAKDLNRPLLSVARWIDQIHDDPRLLLRVQPVEEESRIGIEAAYRDYLLAAEPPEESLHALLASKFGCTIRQAHRAVLYYRWAERLKRLAAPPEQVKEIQDVLSAPPADPQPPADAGEPEEE